MNVGNDRKSRTLMNTSINIAIYREKVSLIEKVSKYIVVEK